MKSKILSLILVVSIFISFITKVSAIGSESSCSKCSKPWLVPTAAVGTVAAAAASIYVGYKLYDHYCFNKVVRFDGKGYGENLRYSRPDHEAKRQIYRIFDNELSRWKRYFNSSAPIKAAYLANVADCLVSIRNYYQQRVITTPEFAKLYDKLWDKISYFFRIMDICHEVKISELIKELHETEALVDEATVLIDNFAYGKRD